MRSRFGESTWKHPVSNRYRPGVPQGSASDLIFVFHQGRQFSDSKTFHKTKSQHTLAIKSPERLACDAASANFTFV
jgi:hypothetical protein